MLWRLEQSGGGRGAAEAEGVRGSQRWAEKGKGGRTMTLRWCQSSRIHSHCTWNAWSDNCQMSILASSTFPTLEELTHNLDSAYKLSAPLGLGDSMAGAVCMFDEIKVEEGLDWCPCTNSIIGLCHEHSGSEACIFSNLDNAQVICEDLCKEDVHFGTEVHS